MPLPDFLRLGAQLPGGFEWIILLIVIAVPLLFGPQKLPELARSIGRAWGEFRRGKLEVERQIQQEFATEPRPSGARLRAAPGAGAPPARLRELIIKSLGV